MKKILKVVSILLLFCLMFVMGYLGCREIGFVGKKKELLLFMKLNNVRNINKNIAGANLDEEDAQFILEHVLGEWKISERIIEIKDADNISSKGIEEMKNLVVIYDKDFVMINGYDQHTFSNRDDIFLYLSYGGILEVNLPVYHIDWHVDEENLGGQGKYYRFPKECELVHVNYNLGYDVGSHSSVLYGISYAASNIYVNPNDKDTIYLDMCGLWELKRVEEEQ